MRPVHALSILGLAAVWGGSYPLIKVGLRDLSPAALVLLRTVVASAVLGAIIAARGTEARAALRAALRHPWRIAVLGFSAIAFPFVLIGAGETAVDSGLAAVLVATVPLFIAAIAPFVDTAEKATRTRLIGMLIGLVGVAVVVGAESIHSTDEALGSLALLVASASYAAGSFVATRWFADVPPLVRSLCAIGGGGILVLPMAVATAPDEMPGAGPLLAVVVLALGGTALAFIALYALMDAVGPARVALNTYFVPVFALAYGAAFLDESMGVEALGGLALVLVGVAYASRKDPAAPVAAEDPTADA